MESVSDGFPSSERFYSGTSGSYRFHYSQPNDADRYGFTIIASRGWDLGDLSNSVLGSNENSWAVVDSLKQDPHYEEAFYKTGYFYYPGNGLTVPSLCVNISNNDKAVYRLMFSGGEVPLDDTFGFILEYLSQMISHALSTGIMHNRDKAFPLHQIFVSILTDPGADYVKVSQQLTNVGWLFFPYVSRHPDPDRTDRAEKSDPQCHLQLSGKYDPGQLCYRIQRGNAVLFINLDLCTMTGP